MNYSSSLDYYRNTHQGWGTSQLHFREPPPPTCAPQPSWSGWDYYNANAVNPDQNLYYTVMNRTRDFGPNGGGDMQEARHWQRRVYSGIVNLSTLLPQEIGMAAAYEAYRMWKYHRGPLFDPLISPGMNGPPGMERVREALVGLAIAEASKLWQYTGRAVDTYGLRDCLESAALTAFRISYTILQGGDAYGSGYAPGGSVPMPGSFGGEPYNEPYSQPYDDPYRRTRRHSTSVPMVMQAQSQPGGLAGGGVGGFGGPPSPYGGGSPLPIPGRAGSGTSSVGVPGSPYAGGTPQYASSGMRRSVSPYLDDRSVPPTVPSYGTAQSVGAGVPLGAPSVGYAGSAGYGAGGGYAQPAYAQQGYAQGGISQSYGGGGLAGPYGAQQPYAGASYAAGGAYPQAGGTYPFPGANPGTVGVEIDGRVIPAQPGSTIIIKSRPRRSSHRHHRSRSSEPGAYRDDRYGRDSYARY
ncbi:hypothetical protein PHLGIDRAFT_125231 [Phlebiopsis gigantea 11061_1 CR5-6]|uniref:Uncharacterized protein n=1 Tax=Phlebiopsis gigantea (strain 11061_1 CR5-6) TaxID=745531 RepID=A0A0C3SET8_PHLG1|nr:hypothetical protein PHLGIDRAFT_125231 [Phlebiopsis gigantea 11061_1 CR5-6]